MFAISGDYGRQRNARLRSAKCAGYSLIELMTSMAILLLVSGGVLSLINFYQQSYVRTEVHSDMYENVRGVAELMTQEIGQAGLVSLPATTLTAAVSSSASAQAVAVSQTASMFVGEKLLVDAGTNEETVTLTAVGSSTMTAVFSKAHASGAPVTALGVFPQGIMPSGVTDGSTTNTLNLFGDINGDGSLVYVRYVCTPGTQAAPGTLTRSVTTITPGNTTISAAQTMLSTVITPSGGSSTCFTVNNVSSNGYTFVTNVGFSLSVQSARPDPQTGAYATMTKSFLNLAPRNVVAGYELAQNSLTYRLQASPTNVASY